MALISSLAGSRSFAAAGSCAPFGLWLAAHFKSCADSAALKPSLRLFCFESNARPRLKILHGATSLHVCTSRIPPIQTADKIILSHRLIFAQFKGRVTAALGFGFRSFLAPLRCASLAPCQTSPAERAPRSAETRHKLNMFVKSLRQGMQRKNRSTHPKTVNAPVFGFGIARAMCFAVMTSMPALAVLAKNASLLLAIITKKLCSISRAPCVGFLTPAEYSKSCHKQPCRNQLTALGECAFGLR